MTAPEVKGCPVTCPKCNAGPGEKCRSLTSNRVTDTHTGRFDVWQTYRDNQRRKAGW